MGLLLPWAEAQRKWQMNRMLQQVATAGPGLLPAVKGVLKGWLHVQHSPRCAQSTGTNTMEEVELHGAKGAEGSWKETGMAMCMPGGALISSWLRLLARRASM